MELLTIVLQWRRKREEGPGAANSYNSYYSSALTNVFDANETE